MKHLFYLIGEHTDEIYFCKRRGLVPFEFQEVLIPGTDITYTKVLKYKSKDYIYSSLESSECYSGYTVTLVREPIPAYDELIIVLEKSRREDDRLGALGLILKRYPDLFIKDIDKLNKKKIYKLLKFVREFNGYTIDVVDRIIIEELDY